MLRSRAFALMAALLALAVVISAPLLAQESGDQDLAQRLEALETRIASLERTLAQRLTAIEKKLSQSPQANPLENEAQAAFAKISQLAAAGDYEKAQADMADFMKKYASTTAAKRARRLHQELSVFGKPIPSEWGIEKWFQGEKEVDLNSGKTTLLVFFEEWCPHCKREVPKMQALYNDLKGEGLQVVGLTKITRSSTEEKLQAFINEKSVGYPIAKENGNVSQHFNVSGIPAAAVVKDGKVVWRGHPAQLNEEKLKSWL